jgi:hypothetical protein
MSVMNDFFKRGYLFDGVTGEKSGANLEDLVTRAVPVAGTQLVDQVTIEDYADAGVVDGNGDPVRRLRVKDGSITVDKMAVNAFLGGPLLSSLVTAAAMVDAGGAWTTPYPDIASGLTEDASSNSGEGIINNYGSAHYCYWDLGAVYIGNILMVVDQKGNSGLCGPISAYDSTGFTTGAGPDKQYNNYWRCDGSTYRAWGQIQPFIGRYVGFALNSGSGIDLYTKIRRFNVYGRAI